MKQYKKHADVPKKYKWDLSFVLEGKGLEVRIEELFKEYEKLLKMKDHVYDSPEKFYESLEFQEHLFTNYSKISFYIRNSLALNVNDEYIKSVSDDYEYRVSLLNQKLGATNAQFFENADKVAEWAKLPKFKDYKYSLEFKLQEKNHQLPKHIEEFRQKSERADISSSDYFEILTLSELNYGFAKTKDGKKIKITEANISKLLKHNDASVRKTSSISYRNAFYKHKDSLASALYQNRKSDSVYSKLLNYNSTLDYFIFDDRVNREFMETLFKSAKNNYKINKPFATYYKKFYAARFGEKMTRYDKSRELTNVKTSFTIEEGIKDFLDSIKPFGEEYVSVVKKGLKENWVDFMNVDGKDTGAYSDAEYGIEKKVILMNWTEDLRSVETIAHEFGHSLHSYFSEKHNSKVNANYTVFVAEIASIFNELLLHDYWLNNSKDDKFKFAILTQKIKGFNRTVFETCALAEYEMNMYDALDRGEPVGTYEAQAKMYYEVMKNYTTSKPDKFKLIDNIDSVTIPHYYYDFYLYKYAIGHLVATIFFEKYKKEGKGALQDYISNFLCVGARKDNLDILKDAGIDLLDSNIYNYGFNYQEDCIKEWVALGKKIYKVK